MIAFPNHENEREKARRAFIEAKQKEWKSKHDHSWHATTHSYNPHPFAYSTQAYPKPQDPKDFAEHKDSEDMERMMVYGAIKAIQHEEGKGSYKYRSMFMLLSKYRPTLEECKAIVGGYIELAYSPYGGQLIVNEDGHSLNLPINRKCCRWLTSSYGQVILGNAMLLMGDAELE